MLITIGRVFSDRRKFTTEGLSAEELTPYYRMSEVIVILY